MFLLHRSMPTQENHEVRFPAASMPGKPPLQHTALGTGTDLRYKVAEPALRLV